jgi:prophage regulatory protein
MIENAIRKLATETITELLGIESKPGTRLLAASLREMLLRIDVVCAITGLSVPTLYRLISQGSFPRPLRITGHARAWKLSEVMEWIDSRERMGA